MLHSEREPVRCQTCIFGQLRQGELLLIHADCETFAHLNLAESSEFHDSIDVARIVTGLDLKMDEREGWHLCVDIDITGLQIALEIFHLSRTERLGLDIDNVDPFGIGNANEEPLASFKLRVVNAENKGISADLQVCAFSTHNVHAFKRARFEL